VRLLFLFLLLLKKKTANHGTSRLQLENYKSVDPSVLFFMFKKEPPKELTSLICYFVSSPSPSPHLLLFFIGIG